MADSPSMMLEKLGSRKPKKTTELHNEEPEFFPQPQLQPSPGMEQAVLNILGHNASKKMSPMDK